MNLTKIQQHKGHLWNIVRQVGGLDEVRVPLAATADQPVHRPRAVVLVVPLDEPLLVWDRCLGTNKKMLTDMHMAAAFVSLPPGGL